MGIVFIDGYHSAEQAKFDFEAFACKLTTDGLILLHDSMDRKHSTIYGPGREYVHTVGDFVAVLKNQPAWQVLDVPFGDGLTVVRRASATVAGGRVAA